MHRKRILTFTDEVLLMLDEFSLLAYRPMLKALEMINGDTQRHALINQITRLKREGYIEKIKRNGDIFYKITESGKTKISNLPAPIHKRSRKWDGKWRIVIFDIPEEDRDKRNLIREGLRELRFGKLQGSVWISPHDVGHKVERMIENYGLGKFMIFFKVDYSSHEEKELISRAWNLTQINERYREYNLKFQAEFEEFKKKRLSQELKEYIAKLFFERLNFAYNEILYDDPELPDEFLPHDWQGFEAWKLYQRCKHYLKNYTRRIHGRYQLSYKYRRKIYSKRKRKMHLRKPVK